MRAVDFIPYYAVIFTSKLADSNGYAKIAAEMEILAKQQEGFISIESARQEVGITVSYWKDVESIQRWKQNFDHLKAQQLGKEKWYESYTVRIAKIEREYSFK